jgi:phosphatidylethanolamine/phosphatidyl-N-methylethanolamine N-methyltransferase
MAAEIDRQRVEKVYARWAPIYDLVFGNLLDYSRRLSIEAAQRAGRRILELGVGTGISLPAYRRDTRVVGVDISEPMLRKAQERVARERLPQVEGLAVMDAARLGFADASFDCAVAQYVITTVPDPEAALDELARVVRPGGEVVLVNHISAERGTLADLERWFARHSGRFGWRAEFPFARISDWVARNGGVRIVERRTVPPFRMFSMIRLERLGAGADARAAAG